MAIHQPPVVGTVARVVGYKSTNSVTDRLKSLGLVPGTTLTVKRVAPLGDPVEVSVRGFSLGLRGAEWTLLQLERCN